MNTVRLYSSKICAFGLARHPDNLSSISGTHIKSPSAVVHSYHSSTSTVRQEVEAGEHSEAHRPANLQYVAARNNKTDPPSKMWEN